MASRVLMSIERKLYERVGNVAKGAVVDNRRNFLAEFGWSRAAILADIQKKP